MGYINNIRPATKKQWGIICMLASQAFDYQDKIGNCADIVGKTLLARKEKWRRIQMGELIGKTSTKKCNQHDYNELVAHFNLLAGRDEQAFKKLMDSSPTTDNGNTEDTPERRRQIAHSITQLLTEAKLEVSYALATASRIYRKGKFLKELTDLNVEELEKLRWTMKKRISNKK